MTRDELHQRIMNLPCEIPTADIETEEELFGYETGFRDARHAAAELVGETEDVERYKQAIEDIFQAGLEASGDENDTLLARLCYLWNRIIDVRNSLKD